MSIQWRCPLGLLWIMIGERAPGTVVSSAGGTHGAWAHCEQTLWIHFCFRDGGSVGSPQRPIGRGRAGSPCPLGVRRRPIRFQLRGQGDRPAFLSPSS